MSSYVFFLILKIFKPYPVISSTSCFSMRPLIPIWSYLKQHDLYLIKAKFPKFSTIWCWREVTLITLLFFLIPVYFSHAFLFPNVVRGSQHNIKHVLMNGLIYSHFSFDDNFSLKSMVAAQISIVQWLERKTLWRYLKHIATLSTLLIFLSPFYVFTFLSIHFFSNHFRGYPNSVKNAIIKDIIGIQIHYICLMSFGSTEPRLYSCWKGGYLT